MIEGSRRVTFSCPNLPLGSVARFPASTRAAAFAGLDQVVDGTLPDSDRAADSHNGEVPGGDQFVRRSERDIQGDRGILAREEWCGRRAISHAATQRSGFASANRWG